MYNISTALFPRSTSAAIGRRRLFCESLCSISSSPGGLPAKLAVSEARNSSQWLQFPPRQKKSRSRGSSSASGTLEIVTAALGTMSDSTPICCYFSYVGFELVDFIAEAEGIAMSTVSFKSAFGKGSIDGLREKKKRNEKRNKGVRRKTRDKTGFIGDVPVMLAKPQTFMNASGESVGAIVSYYKIPLKQVLVMFDDMDLPFAKLRLLPKGGHGGHNGWVLSGCSGKWRMKMSWVLVWKWFTLCISGGKCVLFSFLKEDIFYAWHCILESS
ncbi:UNVERIFIED_CONTAM: Peptidyl-tRNA hydrolase, chloroplastic [Sesamum radiatum]|uniref:Peptidyl-tRNA hydrolase, chloroplastic n=1 Tax=Sesamum radiatum TaxID=300843 RepID=A0AAW2PL17_SESRA